MVTYAQLIHDTRRPVGNLSQLHQQNPQLPDGRRNSALIVNPASQLHCQLTEQMPGVIRPVW